MIENDRQLAAALFQMESFADTLEGMRRHAQETEPSVFTVTAGGFVNLIRERAAKLRRKHCRLYGGSGKPTGGSAVIVLASSITPSPLGLGESKDGARAKKRQLS